MNLYFLKYFRDSFELKSMSKAAERNHVSRAAISKGIQTLERDIAKKLVIHQKRQLNFTSEAELLYPKSIEILKLTAEVTDNFETGHSLTKISMIHSLATGRLSEVISNQTIDRKLEIKIANPSEANNYVERNIVDFAVTVTRDLAERRNELTVHQGYFKLYRSTGKNVKLNTLFITPDWPEVLELKKDSKFLSNFNICVIDSWDAIYSAIKKGKGIGLLPDYFKLDNKKIKTIQNKSNVLPYKVIIKKQNSFSDEELFTVIRSRFKKSSNKKLSNQVTS